MTPVARGLIALAAISLSAACTPPKTQAQKQAEILEGDLAPDRLVARGRAFASVGDYTRAEQYLAAAIDSGAEVRKVLPVLLRVCVAEKRYRAAIAHAVPLLEQDPKDFRLRFVVGSLYANIGENVIAWEHLEKVAEQNPGYAEVHFALGMLALRGESDPVAADEHFREYLRLEPDGSHAAEAQSHLLRNMP